MLIFDDFIGKSGRSLDIQEKKIILQKDIWLKIRSVLIKTPSRQKLVLYHEGQKSIKIYTINALLQSF